MSKIIIPIWNRIYKDIKDYWKIAFILLLYIILTSIILHDSCCVVLITGFPCPGCGLTRAVLALLRLDFKTAWNMNPGVYLFVVICLYYGIRYYIFGKKGSYDYVVFIAFNIILSVIYVVRMFLYFPNVEPMLYRDNNLLSIFLGINIDSIKFMFNLLNWR
jgi:hypothetical protein